MKRQFLLLSLILVVAAAAARDKIRVACVGNSVTYGMGLTDRATQSYPARLQEMLGAGYDVRNFGRNSATLLRKGHLLYVKQKEYADAVAFRADIVVIHLGLNDTDPRNWPQHGDDFIADYRALIDTFRVANPKARIYICLMTPIFHDHRRFDSGTRLWHSLIQRRIAQVAATSNVGLIDLYTPLHCHPNLFPDALHPNAEGAKILASTVWKTLTGNYGGLQLPATFTDHMVLQRREPLVFSGIADAGEKVEIDFHGQHASATTGADGRWRTTLPAEEAGGPYVLNIKTRKVSRTVKDVWVGEVWLCSGQSNMELRLREAADAAENIAAADTCSRLHFYNMKSIVPTWAEEWDSTRLDSVNRLLYILPAQWERSNAEAAREFSAIAFHFGRRLADSLQCHVGLISNAVGGTGCEAWVDRSTLEEYFPAILRQWKENDNIMAWVRTRAALNVRRATSPLQRHPYEPAYLFESGIAPLKDYGVRGVIWYQGESNADNMEVHERLFPLLERSWRTFFQRPNLPFYTVQLSSISTRPCWPAFRDSQRRLAQDQNNTYLTVCSDLGDSLDVHPRAKRPVGERLAASALNHTYGYTSLEPSGPEYTHFTTSADGSLTLHFLHADGLRAAAEGDDLRTFEVAGSDGLYHPATATVSGQCIVVRSQDVAQPKAVRYGWQPFTHANLVNASGLPASTFRDERF